MCRMIGFYKLFPSTNDVATFILENENHSTADARPLPHIAYVNTITKIEILQDVVSLSSTICALSNLMAFLCSKH